MKNNCEVKLVENLKGEEWSPVTGWENISCNSKKITYWISNLGRCKECKLSHCDGDTIQEKLLKDRWNSRGYSQVQLYKDGMYHQKLIHRLVAEAFLPNDRGEANIVDHIDGNPANNNVNNLRWVTPGENNRYCIQNHCWSKKEIRDNFTPKKVLCVETGIVFTTQGCACREYDIKPANMSAAIRTGKTAKGYHWVRVEK